MGNGARSQGASWSCPVPLRRCSRRCCATTLRGKSTRTPSAKWLASGVLEYVEWDDRMPILLQPRCRTQGLGYIGSSRTLASSNKLYSDWGVTYTTAAQLSSTLNRCDFHLSDTGLEPLPSREIEYVTLVGQCSKPPVAEARAWHVCTLGSTFWRCPPTQCYSSPRNQRRS